MNIRAVRAGSVKIFRCAPIEPDGSWSDEQYGVDSNGNLAHIDTGAIRHYHSLKPLEQAEAIEAGTLSPDQVNVGRPGAGADKKSQVIASVTGGTVSASPRKVRYML